MGEFVKETVPITCRVDVVMNRRARFQEMRDKIKECTQSVRLEVLAHKLSTITTHSSNPWGIGLAWATWRGGEGKEKREIEV